MYADIVRQSASSLANLDAQLVKAEAFAASHGLSADAFLQARLAPDMFPLLKQVQLACDVCAITAARVADVAPVALGATESTFADARARIAEVRDFVARLDLLAPAAQDGTRQVPAGYPPDKTMRLHDYVLMRQMPNFYFHLVTAYALMRAGGVQLGKGDYLGALPLY